MKEKNSLTENTTYIKKERLTFHIDAYTAKEKNSEGKNVSSKSGGWFIDFNKIFIDS